MNAMVIDQQERLQALNPNQSFIIQAPAGSGKTELLTQRILALIPTVKKPEEILAITFTNKAAAEMRARVIQKLTHPQDELAKAALAHAQAQGWRLLEFPSRFNIRTIDSFCAQLVRSTPFVSGAGSNPKQTENAQELFEEAALQVLAQNQAHTIALLEHLDNNWDGAVKLIADMLGKREQWLEAATDERYVEKMVWLYPSLIRASTEPILSSLKQIKFDRLHRYVQFSINCFQVMNNDDVKAKLPWHDLKDWQGESLLPYDEVTGEVDFEAIHKLKLCLDFFCTKSKNAIAIRQTLNKNQGFPSDADFKKLFSGQENLKADCLLYFKEELAQIENIEAVLELIRVLPSSLPSLESLEIIHNLLMVLNDAERVLQDVFRKHATVDFQEIALRAVQALGGAESPSELLLKKDNQIQHILIDEFQDTSYAQMRLLHLLISGWQSHDGRTLFLVGDPMQSIYRFRKAEVGLFLTIWENKKVAHLPITPLSLKVNFRSDQGVIEWVNRSFSSIFPRCSHASHGVIEYSPSTAFRPADPEVKQAVQFHVFESTQTDVEDALLEDLAQTCRQALQKYADSDKPAIAILVRMRSHIERLLPHLKAAQIPFNCVELMPLKDQSEVMDLVQLIRAISLPHDRLAWASFLRSPLCGLSLSSLAYLFSSERNERASLPIPQLLTDYVLGRQPWPSGLSSREQAQLGYVAQHMLLQQIESSSQPFSTQIVQLWHALGGDKIYTQENEQKNIGTILELVDGLAPYGVIDVFELDKAIERLNASANSQSPAVEIMTMHKAKGLEFNEVILFDLNRKAGQQDSQLIYGENVRENGEQKGILLSPIKHSLEDQKDPYTEFISYSDKQRGFYETQRLLYVAATRAKKVLHLFANQIDKVEKTSLWQHLLAVLPPELAPKKSDDKEGRSAKNDNAEAGYEERIYPVSLTQDVPAVRTVLKEEVFQELVQLYPISSEVKDIFSTPSDSSMQKLRARIERPAAYFGELFHQIMEYIARDRGHNWDVTDLPKLVPVFKKLIYQYGLELEQTLDRLMSLVHNALSHRELVQYLKHENCHPEWALYDAKQKHVIDLLVDTGQEIVFIDYKTSTKHNDDETDEVFRQSLVDSYSQQIHRYYDLLKSLYGADKPIKAYLYATELNELIPVEQ